MVRRRPGANLGASGAKEEPTSEKRSVVVELPTQAWVGRMAEWPSDDVVPLEAGGRNDICASHVTIGMRDIGHGKCAHMAGECVWQSVSVNRLERPSRTVRHFSHSSSFCERRQVW